MKAFVASSGEERTVAAALAALEGGGNAVDAAIAAALIWPPALSAAGAFLARGAGMGKVACRFPARVPGLGLSRPRRVRLFAAGAPASFAATPSLARALAAVSSRWGALGLPTLLKAATVAVGNLSHAEALEHLADLGAAGAVKGAWALAAARSLGPLAGGLLTRRDLIEARAELDEGVAEEGFLATSPLASSRATAAASSPERRTLSVFVLDGRGNVAAIVLDAGFAIDGCPEVMGVPANTLLRGMPSGTARRVGRTLPVLVGAASTLEDPPLVLSGPLDALSKELGRRHAETWDLDEVCEGVLAVRAGPSPQVGGASSQGVP